MTRKEYISRVKEYVGKSNISLGEYFYQNAKKIRSGKKFQLEDFELENPFVTERDIKKLIEAKDDRIEIFYSNAMLKAIRLCEQKLQEEEELQRRMYEAMKVKEAEKAKKAMMPLPLPRKKEETSLVPRQTTAMIPYEKKQESLVPYENATMTKETPKDTETLKREDIISVVNDEIEKKSKFGVVLKSISRKLTDILKGFAVIREEKTGRMHYYYHDPKTDILKGNMSFQNAKERIESGYYVNYEEYVESIMNETIEQNPNMTRITMVRDDGRETTFGAVAEEAFQISKKYGIIKLGKELKGKDIKTFEELRKMNLEGEEIVASEKLRKGVYVRRDIISRIFDKHKMRIESKKEEETHKANGK